MVAFIFSKFDHNCLNTEVYLMDLLPACCTFYSILKAGILGCEEYTR